MQEIDSLVLNHVKSIRFNFPTTQSYEIRGTIYHYEDQPRPLLILIGTPAWEENLVPFAKYLSLLGYVCMLPCFKHIGKKSVIETEYLTAIIQAFNHPEKLPEELQGIIRPQSIGLFGYSGGAKYCHQVSENNSDQAFIRGIFSLAPTSTRILTVRHPLFVMIGSADYRPNLISWERSNVAKSGLILSGGKHTGYFRNTVEEAQSSTSDLRHDQLENEIQFSVLYRSIDVFFQEVFSPNSMNLSRALLKLQAQYENLVQVLYYNPYRRLVLEGTELTDEEWPKILLKPWKGELIIDGKPKMLVSGEDCHFSKPSNNSIRHRFLCADQQNFLSGFELDNYRFHVSNYLDMIRAENSATLLLDDRLNEPVQAIVEILENTCLDSTDKKHLPFDKAALPFVVCLTVYILRFTSCTVLNFKLLTEQLLKANFSAADFLLSVFSLINKYIADPWRHAAFGKELIWNGQNVYYTISNLSKIDISKSAFVSLRLGQSYLSKGKTLGNTLGEAQEIDAYLFMNEQEYQVVNIQVEAPILRREKFSEPIDIIPPNIILHEGWITDIGLQCYLAYYLIPIPPEIKQLQKIELRFRSPSGAIMLSEVALTN